MEAVVFIAIVMVFVAALVILSPRMRASAALIRARRQAERARWDEVARALGGTAEPDRWLRASVGGVTVSVKVEEQQSTSTNADGTTSTSTSYSTIYRFEGPFAAGLALAREGALSRAFGSDLELGDPGFDRQVKVGAGAELLLGLSADERAMLSQATAAGWSVRQGALLFSHGKIDGEELEGTIARGLALARMLDALSAERGARLVARVEDDPSAWVRIRALAEVGARPELARELALAVPRALSDPTPIVRLAAALRVDHHPTLGALALPAGPACALAELVRDDDEATSLMAIEGLARAGVAEHVPLLAPLRDKLLGGGERKKAARAAIERIQARLAGAERGALTLAHGEAGDLAVVDEGTGER